MSAYVVFEAVVTDPGQYERYKELAAPSVAAAGGRFIVRGGEVTAFEGDEPAAPRRARVPDDGGGNPVVPE